MEAVIHGLKVHYSVAGPEDGIPVVFIHGFPFSSDMWSAQVAFLNKDFRCITYDVRGHGASEAGDGQYTLELFVDDLIGLLDHLRIDRAVLVGLSMGGYIALRTVERNPERCRALVLCDTRSEGDSNESKIRRANQGMDVKTKGSSAFASAFVKAVFREQSFQTRPLAVERIRQTIERMSPMAIAGTLTALAARTDTTTSLPKIGVPALVLVGEDDKITPPADARAMQQKIPSAQIHIIPSASHLSNLENEPVFNHHLLEFLKTLG
jgi:3-oxoadipate enol-lactonase